VTFEPRVAPTKDGKAQTTAAFTKPGDYVLRGRASDRLLSAFTDIKLTVK
jgi:hypothetical protein